MKLKYLSAATLLGAAFSLPATAHEVTGSLGILSTKLDSQFEQSGSSTNKSYFNGSESDLEGEIALGYVWTINRGFDMAFELFYDFGGPEVKQTTGFGAGHATHSIDSIWGFRVLPGFYVTTNTKVFLDIGYASIDNELSIKNQGGTGGFSKKSKSTDSAAYRYGAGVQTMIYDNFSLRMSYVVMDGASSVKVTNDAGTESLSVEPTVYNFAANLTYHFNF